MDSINQACPAEKPLMVRQRIGLELSFGVGLSLRRERERESVCVHKHTDTNTVAKRLKVQSGKLTRRPAMPGTFRSICSLFKLGRETMFENRLSSLRVFLFCFSPFSPTQVQGLLMGWPQGIGTCGEDLVGAREVKGGGGGEGRVRGQAPIVFTRFYTCFDFDLY